MRSIFAVVLAGLVATMVDNFAAWRLFQQDFAELSQTYGRYVVAITGAALLPWIFAAFGVVLGALIAFVVLAGGTALLALAAFSDIAPLHVIAVSTSIYAVTAIFVYLSVMAPSRQTAQNDVKDLDRRSNSDAPRS